MSINSELLKNEFDFLTETKKNFQPQKKPEVLQTENKKFDYEIFGFTNAAQTRSAFAM